ncbi:MAG: glucose-1-phosphate adenylyltransferase [Candidatus Competibacteraceae bacterium]|nr:glucose-1-phosphate adenylyltransferase [Candidatus Competibacteraceae bacterium]
MKRPKILSFVMAGGEGSRLHPLTAQHSKPSLPFGSRYRIVDFVLSNLINSGMHAIYLLVQYKSQSLIEHIRKSWVMSALSSQQFVTVVPPQMHSGTSWFQGTADAVYQNLDLIQHHHPDLVIVFGADHIYRMDVQQMIHYHQERKADVTVAALPVPLAEASAFGVIAADEEGHVQSFQEKPKHPAPLPSDPNRAYASMGNYIFDADVLVQALKKAHQEDGKDFGHHVLPGLLHECRIYAYNFSTNRVPGVKRYEETGYWRDVGTIDAYFQAHQDILGLKPRFNMFNPQWPIYSSNYQGPTANIIDSTLDNTLLGGGTLLQGAKVGNSVIRREVALEKGVELEDCIIHDYVRIKRGARLRRTIVGRYNVIESGTRIGYDRAGDRKLYDVSPTGIVVVPSGEVSNAMQAFGEDI